MINFKYYTLKLTIFMVCILPMYSQTNPTIAVIGAGIAGLTTAYRLHKKGFNVQIYEARNRVGGRILSVFINETVAELGGENITDGGDAENLHQLIQELDIELVHTTIPFNYAIHHNETLLSNNDLIKNQNFDTSELKTKLHTIKSNSKSMYDVLSQLFQNNDPFYRLFSTRLASYEGAAIEELSSRYVTTLYYMLNNSTCLAHQNRSFARIKDGNSTLIELLAKKLDNKIHLNKELISLTRNQNKYQLAFNNKETITADIVVLTIPCPIYNDIIFDADTIPADRLATIRSIRNGSNAKIIVPLLKSCSTSTVFVDDSFLIFSFCTNMMTCYFNSDLSKFDQQSIVTPYAQAQPLLSAGYKNNYNPTQLPIYANDKAFEHYSGPVGYSWPTDPWAQGSYSYIAPGKDYIWDDTYEDHGLTIKKLFAPIDNLFFAGEHTSTLFDVPGTMEAACQSGNMAARMIEQKMYQRKLN